MFLQIFIGQTVFALPSLKNLGNVDKANKNYDRSGPSATFKIQSKKNLAMFFTPKANELYTPIYHHLL